jgi:hypothetical protein
MRYGSLKRKSDGVIEAGPRSNSRVSPLAWRYGPVRENNELAKTEDVQEDYVLAYAGSGTPQANPVPAFTSPTRSWVRGQPGYGSGASRGIGNKS